MTNDGWVHRSRLLSTWDEWTAITASLLLDESHRMNNQPNFSSNNASTRRIYQRRNRKGNRKENRSTTVTTIVPIALTSTIVSNQTSLLINSSAVPINDLFAPISYLTPIQILLRHWPISFHSLMFNIDHLSCGLVQMFKDQNLEEEPFRWETLSDRARLSRRATREWRRTLQIARIDHWTYHAHRSSHYKEWNDCHW